VVDLRIILDTTWDARSQWYNVGLELGLSPDSLDAIKGDNRECADCYRTMLKQWLKGKHPRPTLAALAEALGSRAVNMGHLAQQLPPMEKGEL
jgi:hypothetical protein